MTDPISPRAPRQSLPVNLGLGALVLALVLGGLEGTARLFERPRPAPAVASYIWDWEDKWSGDFYTVGSGAVGWPPWEEYNADGMRDRAHASEKLDGMRRAVFLGDSVTLGAGIETRQAYPQVLQERLDQEGRRLEAFNVALWGWSTRQEAIAYRRIVRKYAPDAVVVGVCLNDIPELQNNLSRPPAWLAALFRRSALVRRLLDAEGKEIRSVEELFTQADSPRVGEGLERFFAELRALRDEIRKDRASLALVVFPFRFQLAAAAPPASVQERIASFCAAEKIPCLDMLPRLRTLGESAFLDYDHLSVKGSAATAEAILESSLLPRAPSEREILAARTGEDALVLLAAPEADTRAAAAWGLGSDARGVQALGLALREDGSSLVRFRAAGSLGALGRSARGASLALFQALRDERQAVRWAAAQALWKTGLQAPPDLEPLVQALANPDPYVRSFAAWSLGEMGPAAQETVPALVEALRLEEGEGGAAARALAKLGPVAAGAVPALVEQLKSPEARRRFTAAEALGRIGAPAQSAVPKLIESLRDDDGRVRASAAQALGRMGPEARAAIPALEGVLKGDEDPHSRALAARALGQIGPASRAAVGTLNAAANDPDPSVRREVAEGTAPDPRALISRASAMANMIPGVKAGIGLIVLLGVGASSRSATIAENEAAAMEDLRSVVAALAAYQAFNCGYYADLGCLLHPLPCGLRAAPPSLIDPGLANLQRRHGYRRAFYPGRQVRLGGGRACSSSSLVSYAYTAVPERVGVTGNRAFCIDESGFIRQFHSGTGVAGGHCLPGLMAEEALAVSAEEQERRVIAELRTLASAEEAYRSSNGGFYDQTRCLAEPWVCVPRYPRDAPVFIEPRIADLRERHGYRRRFYPGARRPTLDRWSSPSSLLGYAYTATPVRDGPPGRRGFCLDPTGGMCQTADGSEPPVADGKCQSCEPLAEGG